MNKVKGLFEAELGRRGISFEIDSESGRYVIVKSDGRFLVSVDNLDREFARDGDESRIVGFIDTFAVPQPFQVAWSRENLYWALEPNDYEELADFRHPVSDRVDRVLVHNSAETGTITWITPEILAGLGLTMDEASEQAFQNLSKALSEAKVESSDIDGVSLGMIGTKMPFKSALILAPNLREMLEPSLGWPLLAVVPDRDFLYFWDARHTDFARRVGEVVVREFTESPYPISPEVFEISDSGIEAIGEFPT